MDDMGPLITLICCTPPKYARSCSALAHSCTRIPLVGHAAASSRADLTLVSFIDLLPMLTSRQIRPPRSQSVSSKSRDISSTGGRLTTGVSMVIVVCRSLL